MAAGTRSTAPTTLPCAPGPRRVKGSRSANKGREGTKDLQGSSAEGPDKLAESCLPSARGPYFPICIWFRERESIHKAITLPYQVP